MFEKLLWLPRSAFDIQQKQIHTALHYVGLKVLDEVQSLIADLAEEMCDRGIIPHHPEASGRLCFSLPAGRQVCYF